MITSTETPTQPIAPGLLKPGAIRRKSVRLGSNDLVKMSPLFPGKEAPLLIQPNVDGLNLSHWAAEQKESINNLLLKHRALLFRNFAVKTADDFQECVKATSVGEMLEYVDRTTPRPAVGNKIYVSTVYPSEETINAHNEGTYWTMWPLKIYFCSIRTADTGGETPITDTRKVFQRISPATREKFLSKNVMYVRNYGDGFGLPWQETFQTNDRAEVEKYCREHDITFEWKDGNRLRTRQIRPAIREHPLTGEMVWFNHAAFFHISTYDQKVREALLSAFKIEDLPYNTYYGDGSPIEPEVAEELRVAYREEKIVFPWRDGDVLLLDNMSMAHGREPYTGKREVIVAMVEPFNGTKTH